MKRKNKVVEQKYLIDVPKALGDTLSELNRLGDHHGIKKLMQAFTAGATGQVVDLDDITIEVEE